MAIINLNAAQKKTVRYLKTVTYGIVQRRTALALIAKGVCREVVIQPAPTNGIAVNLTILGRSL